MGQGSARILNRIAAVGIGDGTPTSIADIGDVEWADLLMAISRARLTGLTLEAIAQGELITSESQRDELSQVHQHRMVRAMQLDHEMLRVCGILQSSGIEYRLLKGCAHAYLLYPDPGMRPYVDVDVMVRGDRFADAITALATVGIERRLPELRPGFDRRFGKGATLHAPSGTEVDLHRTLAAGSYAMTIDANHFFEGEHRFTVAGQALTALTREDRFLHTCFHTSCGNQRPWHVPLRDVVNAVLDPQLDIDQALRTAEQWQAREVIARAVRRAWTELQPAESPAVVAWARSYTPSKHELHMMRGYEGDDRTWARQARIAIRDVRGLRAKGQYLAAILAPSPAAVAARGNGTRLARLRSALRLRDL
jgi:Uncharacterised nucleotidyltransferase